MTWNQQSSPMGEFWNTERDDWGRLARRTERECERPLSSFCQVTTGRVGALTNFPFASLIPRSLSGHAKVVNAAPGGRKVGGRSVSRSQPPSKTWSELTISLTWQTNCFPDIFISIL